MKVFGIISAICLVICSCILVYIIIPKRVVYADAIILKYETKNMSLAENINIKDIYTVKPNKCNQDVVLEYSHENIQVTNNILKPLATGKYDVVFKVKSCQEYFIEKTLSLNITEEINISANITSLQISINEEVSLENNLTFTNCSPSDLTHSFSTEGIVEFDKETLTLNTLKQGETSLTLSVYKSQVIITVKVVRNENLYLTMSLSKIGNDYISTQNALVTFAIVDQHGNTTPQQDVLPIAISDGARCVPNSMVGYILTFETAGIYQITLSSEIYSLTQILTIRVS